MFPGPTEFLLIGCLTESIWIPRFKSGTLTPNTRLADVLTRHTSHVTNGMIFFVCSTSAISTLFGAPRISVWLAAPKGWRKGCKNNQKKTGLWRNPGQRRWTWPVLLLQVLHLWTVRLRREARGDSKLQVDRLDSQGGEMQALIKIPIPTQRRVLKDGKGMLNCSSAQGNLWQLNTKDVQEIPKFQKIQNPRKSPDCVPHWERYMIGNRRIIWKTSMWTQQFGVCSCLSHFKLQFRDHSLNLRSVKN